MRTTSGPLMMEAPAADMARYMATVHLIMAGGLLISALTAVAVYSTPNLYSQLFTDQGLTLLGWIITLAPLAIVLLFAGMVQRMSVAGARLLFLLFAIATGASLASLFAAYAAASIALTLAATAGGYAVLALAGYTTARDLSGLGKFMLMLLFGLIIAMLLNLFLRSAGLDFLLACIGVFVFAALIAVDSQRIRQIYEADESGASAGQLAVLGALTLYPDFLNLFLSLIRLTGRRRD